MILGNTLYVAQPPPAKNHRRAGRIVGVFLFDWFFSFYSYEELSYVSSNMFFTYLQN